MDELQANSKDINLTVISPHFYLMLSTPSMPTGSPTPPLDYPSPVTGMVLPHKQTLSRPATTLATTVTQPDSQENSSRF